FTGQKDNAISSALSAGDTFAGKYNRSILDFLDSARLGQSSIDTQATNNELAKMQGAQDILGMVGRGIRSGGVMLANKNASNSSGVEGIARAYGQIGQREMGKIGNQYEQGNMKVQDAQKAFDIQQASGLRNLTGTKEENVNSIVSELGTNLSALEAKMAEASLPERIAIEQEKARIKAEVIAKLQAYDQQLNSGVADINPLTGDAIREKAGQLMRAGTNLGADAFNYTNEVPAILQGGPAPGAGLPIYTLPRRKEG
ncbi:MAG: hypothetical protein KDH96_11510, partial [Candidatus Riesia sp.]|nr:hypothetical protein [Candidatus Riesia sp.]